MIICEMCNKRYENTRLLASHVAVSHKDVSPVEYTIQNFYGGKLPMCKCGCNIEAPYRCFGKFMTYISGHNSNDNNNFKGKHHTQETILKIINSDGYKNRKSKGKYQPRHTVETKIKMSHSHMGKKRTESQKINYRIAAIKRIEKNKFLGSNVVTNFNPYACKLIDEYGEKMGYNFRHALNGGEHHIKELGYFVDGYDIEKNIVIEVDEHHHFDVYGNLRKKDVLRQTLIQSHLKCQFIRIKLNGEKI